MEKLERRVRYRLPDDLGGQEVEMRVYRESIADHDVSVSIRGRLGLITLPKSWLIEIIDLPEEPRPGSIVMVESGRIIPLIYVRRAPVAGSGMHWYLGGGGSMASWNQICAKGTVILMGNIDDWLKAD